MKKVFYFVLLLGFQFGFSQKPKLKTSVIDTQQRESKIYSGFDGLGNNYYIAENVFIKQDAAKQLGYNYEIWVYDNKGTKLETHL